MSKIQVSSNVPVYDAHIVPCKIHHNGDANTKDYFTPSKEIDSVTQAEICYFRGCKFIGRKLEIPYTGHILNKSEALAGDGDDYKIVNNYTSVGQFENVYVYGHDRMPKLTDEYMLMNEWNDLSNIIHS